MEVYNSWVEGFDPNNFIGFSPTFDTATYRNVDPDTGLADNTLTVFHLDNMDPNLAILSIDHTLDLGGSDPVAAIGATLVSTTTPDNPSSAALQTVVTDVSTLQFQLLDPADGGTGFILEDAGDFVSASGGTTVILDNGDGTFIRLTGTDLPTTEPVHIDDIGPLAEVTLVEHLDASMVLIPADTEAVMVDATFLINALYSPETLIVDALLSGDNVITSGAGLTATDEITIVTGDGTDTVTGGVADETVILGDVSAGDVVNLDASSDDLLNLGSQELGGDSQGATVDLSSGNFSGINEVVGTVYGDTITGADANAEFFVSGEGDDTLTGGTGAADGFGFFNVNSDFEQVSIGDNVITDFKVGGDADQLLLAMFDNMGAPNVTSLADLNIAVGATDTVITAAAGQFTGSITLQGFTTPLTEGMGGDVQFACFPAGTMFLTPEGEKPVETLKEGDLLVTLEGAHTPVQFMGVQSMEADPVHGHVDRNLPILIKKDALGPNCPSRDLTTTWWHSVMIEGDWVEQQFGSRQIFVPAGRLVNGESIVQVETRESLRVYVPMLGAHEVVYASGAPVETFRPDNGNQHSFDNKADYPLHHMEQDAQEAAYPSKFPRIMDKDQCKAITAHLLNRNLKVSMVA